MVVGGEGQVDVAASLKWGTRVGLLSVIVEPSSGAQAPCIFLCLMVLLRKAASPMLSAQKITMYGEIMGINDSRERPLLDVNKF